MVPGILIHPARTGGKDVKDMTSDEFREIHDAWMELRTIYDDLDAMNEEMASGREIAVFGTYAAPVASVL